MNTTNEQRLSLITDDDFEHPNYPNKTRLKVIPNWETSYTFEQNQYRLIAEAQAQYTAKDTKSAIADEVRALIKEELECFQDEGYNEALQAVLKLIEGKK